MKHVNMRVCVLTSVYFFLRVINIRGRVYTINSNSVEKQGKEKKKKEKREKKKKEIEMKKTKDIYIYIYVSYPSFVPFFLLTV